MDSGMRREISQEPDHEESKIPRRILMSVKEVWRDPGPVGSSVGYSIILTCQGCRFGLGTYKNQPMNS